MIRCEQKGPHQQVRFRLSLSVLPTAPGIISPVSPAHSPPTPPRALPSAREDYPAGEEPGATTLALRCSLRQPQSQGWSPAISVFLELPPNLGPQHHCPGISQLSSVRALLEARKPSQVSRDRPAPRHGTHSPPRKATLSLGAPWGCGGFRNIPGPSGQWRVRHHSHFYYLSHVPLLPGLRPMRRRVQMSQAEGMH